MLHRGIMMIWLISCLMLFSVLREVSCQQPGVKLQIAPTGLNYAASVAVDVFAVNINNQIISYVNGTDSVLIVGHVDYNANGVTISKFKKPSTTITVNQGKGVTWAMTNAGFFVTGGWEYWYTPFIIGSLIHAQGTFDLTVTGVSTSLTLTVGRDSNDRPTISVLGCSCTIGKISLTLRGGVLAWFSNLFTGFVDSSVKTALQKIVCAVATKTVNTNGANQLATLQTNVPISDEIEIDYGLVEVPSFTSSYVQSSHKGECFLSSDHTVPPFVPRTIVTDTPTRMYRCYVSEYPFNTLAQVVQKEQILNYVLTKDSIKNPTLLSTECTTGICAGTLRPRWKSDYPNSFIELTMQTTVRPRLTISKDSAAVAFQGQIEIEVRQSGTETLAVPEKLLSLDVSASCYLSVGVRENNITAVVTRCTYKVTVASTDTISKQTLSDLNKFIEIVGDLFIIPRLNDVGRIGFPIPSLYHVKLVSPNVVLTDGVLVISADVKYTP